MKTILSNQVLLDHKLAALEGTVGSGQEITNEPGVEDNDEVQPAILPEYTNITQKKHHQMDPDDIPLDDNGFSESDRKLMKASRLTFKVPTNFTKAFALACPCNSGTSCKLAPNLTPGYTGKIDVACEEDCCHFFFTVLLKDTNDTNGEVLDSIVAGTYELGSDTFKYQEHSIQGQSRLKLLHHLLYTHHLTLEDSKKHLPFLASFKYQKHKLLHERWFISKFIEDGDPLLCKPTFLTNQPSNTEVAQGNEHV